MISKNDCLLLLSELKDNGIDIANAIKTLFNSKDLSIDVVKFINDNRELDITKFYEKLRKSYNDKKSKLYINIVKDIDDVNDVLTTLSSLNLLILLYAKQVENRLMFLKHARSKEISLALAKYFTDYDLTICLKLLRLIKADLKCLESI